MAHITSLDQLVEQLSLQHKRCRLAVVMAEDENTLGAVSEAVDRGFVEAYMLGDKDIIEYKCCQAGIDSAKFSIIHIPDAAAAAAEAVRMARGNQVDMVMKGLIGTDKFLRAILDKSGGLLLPNAVMTYVCALQIPSYHKLLFITDTAVIPFPTVKQRMAMLNYAVSMAQAFGVETPKVALVSAVEKPTESIPSTLDDCEIVKSIERNGQPHCIVDGPLDLFLACDKKSIEIKCVATPVDGDADVLVFPSIEACNAFYKGLVLFAGAELGGFIQGTSKPVIMMSRSESPKSKLYCIAAAAMMSFNN